LGIVESGFEDAVAGADVECRVVEVALDETLEDVEDDAVSGDGRVSEEVKRDSKGKGKVRFVVHAEDGSAEREG
jgi:hypothetical protein